MDKAGGIPVYRRLADTIKKEILSGLRAPGSSLPSERTMAAVMKLHRNTVAKAYHELKAEGLIESRQGVGYTVMQNRSEQVQGHASHKSAPDQVKNKKVNWKAQIKDEYLDMEVTFDDLFQRAASKEVISMGSGIACPGIYRRDEIAETLAELITQDDHIDYFHSPYKGDRNLRQKIAALLSTKGVRATAGQIQILTETNQALDFVVMLLVKPGDTVIMEEPVSPDAYRAMELAGANVMTVPVDAEGMDTAALQRLAEAQHPALIFVNSGFQDPTGTLLSLARRKEILQISNRYRIPVVEADETSELVYDGEKLPPLKAFDTSGNVIYIYSFAMTFVPGMKLAFVVADKQVIQSLSYLVSVRMESVDWVTQKLIAEYLEDGTYGRRLAAFRENYARKQQMVFAALDEMTSLGISYRKPRGGVYVWCNLPEGIDSKDFINRAYQNGLALLPGYVFYPFKNGGRDTIRINYSFETEERLAEGLAILKRLLEKEIKK